MKTGQILSAALLVIALLCTIVEARYYDPIEGRFISKDPIAILGNIYNNQYNVSFDQYVSSVKNSYMYTDDNPINKTDPYGLCAEDACIGEGIAVGIAACLEHPACINTLRAGVAAIGAAIGNLICKEDFKEKECNENLERDLATCRALGKRGGKQTYEVCRKQAMERYGRCLQGTSGIFPPLPHW